mgnify:CR=1 FL=1
MNRLNVLVSMACLLPLFLLAQQGPIKVEIRENKGAFQLYRGGEPYYIKGVGGQEYLDRAVAYGANSIRTWGSDDAIRVLDEAQEKGLTVLFGLWVGQERQGFDYNDAKAVKAQLEQFRAVVTAYKDHPAVLMWGIGNENDLEYTNFKVWDAINDIAKMIHEIDPNHPTLHVTAGIDVAEVQLIKDRAPHIDILGINTYGGLIGIDKEVRAYGWEGPYLISEWGSTGHWEVPKTEWGAPIEQSSSEKAHTYRPRYEQGIAADPEKCIGSYVFLWGQKQETTPTWYGVFTANGEESEVIDVLEYVWSGKWPENRAPQIKAFTIDGKKAIDNIYLKPGGMYQIVADAHDPDGDELIYEWVVLESEFGLTGSGGDVERAPDAIKIAMSGGNPEIVPREVKVETESVITRGKGVLNFRAPRKTGPYRFFVYIYDDQGNVATANSPFFVR